MSTPKAIIEGLRRWEEKDYFCAHEEWEHYWHTIRKDETRKEEAKYVQGMIQLAVALVHYERGNMKWYEKLLGSGPELLGITEEEPYKEIKKEELIAKTREIKRSM